LRSGSVVDDLGLILSPDCRDLRVVQSTRLLGGVQGMDPADEEEAETDQEHKFRKVAGGKGNKGSNSSSGSELKVSADLDFRNSITSDVDKMMRSFGNQLCERFEQSIKTTLVEVRQHQAKTDEQLQTICKRLDEEASGRELLKVELQEKITKLEAKPSTVASTSVGGSAPVSAPRFGGGGSGSASFSSPVSVGSAGTNIDSDIITVIGSWGKRARISAMRADLDRILGLLPLSVTSQIQSSWVAGASSKVALVRTSSWSSLWELVTGVKNAQVHNPHMSSEGQQRCFWASKDKSSQEISRVGPISKAVYVLKSALGISKDDDNSSSPLRDIAGDYSLQGGAVWATHDGWVSEQKLVDFTVERENQVDQAVLDTLGLDLTAEGLLKEIYAGRQ